MIYFLDASALVKRYVQEPGSERIRALVRMHKDLAVSRVSYLEVATAFARRVHRGHLAVGTAHKHVQQLAADFERLRVVELRPPVLELSVQASFQHALRAYDAL